MTYEDVQRILDQLPPTPDGIAELLRTEGIRGEKCNSARCPIAAYLEGKGVERPSVGLNDVAFGANPDYRNRVSLPHRVKRFIDLVDAGRYPQITATGND